MSVYVETNFLLELIRRQEEFESCRQLLDLARLGRIKIGIPLVCFPEATEVVRNLRRDYNRLIDQIDSKLRDFRRGETARHYLEDVDRSRLALTAIIDDELEQLSVVNGQVGPVLRHLPFDRRAKERNGVLEALEILQGKPWDRMVLATISADMHKRQWPQCIFVTRDRDFGTEDVQRDLRGRNCKTFFSYQAALSFLHHRP